MHELENEKKKEKRKGKERKYFKYTASPFVLSSQPGI